MPKTQIRPLTPDDEPSLWTVMYYAISVPSGQLAPAPEVVREPEIACYVAGWMQRPGDFGFIVEEEGQPIGAAWARCWSGEERGYGFVDEATPELSIALLPGFRGRGVGTALLRHLLAAAAGRYAAVSLSVSLTNPARRLYERVGFVPVGEVEGDSLTMVKMFVA